MMTLHLICQIALGIGCICCLLCILRGVRLIQRAGGGETLRCNAVVRQVRAEGRYGMRALLTLNIEESVLHVECHLPGQWFRRVPVSATDILPVLWHRGDTEAVAERTIRHGQVLFTVGMLALALLGLAAFELF